MQMDFEGDNFMSISDVSLQRLREMMQANGARRILVKALAPNDNSKNQPYVAKDEYSAFNILPTTQITTGMSEAGNKIIKATIPFYWLQLDGTANLAPHAKLIFYPQYPEMRLSGFLSGATNAPSQLMKARQNGRLLFLGITNDRRIIAWVTGPSSAIANEYHSYTNLEQIGVFQVLPSQKNQTNSTKQKLFDELLRVHQLNWIDSKSLKSDGQMVACNSSHCVGYTLEAELGISRNGKAEPDYLGWEIKASEVSGLERNPTSKAITLMTPEPTAGFYKENGVSEFVRRYGYADKLGREDRLNFGGIFRNGQRNTGTGLTLILNGYDISKMEITDLGGAIALLDDDGRTAAAWSFSRLIEIWTRKHALAVYVPAIVRLEPQRQYSYGARLRVAEGTDFSKFLAAIAKGDVYFDPGIKLEDASSNKPRTKRRSQFRISSSKIGALYETMSVVNLC